MQYNFIYGINIELAAYLGTIVESPIDTKWQIFELYHTAVSDLYSGSDEKFVSRIIIGRLAKNLGLISSYSLYEQDYMFWLNITKEILTKENSKIRSAAKELYKEEYGYYREITLQK